MKAVIYEKFGSPDGLEYREVEKPTVMEDDILMKFHFSSMNAIDWHIRVPTPSMARLLGGSAKKPLLETEMRAHATKISTSQK